MKKTTSIMFIGATLALTACEGSIGRQWIDPDKTFAAFEQPDIKGVNATQEEQAIEAAKAGDLRRAGQFYEQLVDVKNAKPADMLRYKLGLADTLRRTGDNENALGMFEQLVQENPDNLEAQEGRGLCLMGQGKTVDAGRVFSDIMDKDPKRWRTLNALGILFTAKNMIPEALEYYTEALAQSPDNPAILNNMGLSRAIDKQYAGSIDALQKATAASKNAQQRKQVELNLAMVYGVSGDLDTAKQIAGKYLEGAALDNNLGLYAHLAKDDALAKTYLNMALSQNQSFYERAWNNLDAIGGNAGGTGMTTNPQMQGGGK